MKAKCIKILKYIKSEYWSTKKHYCIMSESTKGHEIQPNIKIKLLLRFLSYFYNHGFKWLWCESCPIRFGGPLEFEPIWWWCGSWSFGFCGPLEFESRPSFLSSDLGILDWAMTQRWVANKRTTIIFDSSMFRSRFSPLVWSKVFIYSPVIRVCCYEWAVQQCNELGRANVVFLKFS